jgi:hypothetical protein
MKKGEQDENKKRAKEMLVKKRAVDKYMMHYDELIRKTIRENNDSIYKELF